MISLWWAERKVTSPRQTFPNNLPGILSVWTRRSQISSPSLGAKFLIPYSSKLAMGFWARTRMADSWVSVKCWRRKTMNWDPWSHWKVTFQLPIRLEGEGRKKAVRWEAVWQKSDECGHSSKQEIDIRHEKVGLRFMGNLLELQPSQVKNDLQGCGAF